MGPPRIARRQEIRDGYARDVEPTVRAARVQAVDGRNVDPYWDRSPEYGREWDALMARYDAGDTQDQAKIGLVERLPARVHALHRKSAGEPGHGSAQVYVPPPPDPQYRADADYPSVVVANTRVVPTENPRPDADTARFQTQLAIAQ